MPSEVRGKAFLKWKSIDLSSKLSLTYEGNVNYYKSVHHPIPILPVGTGTPWQFSKQINKLSFQLSFQIYSLLAQTKGERKTFSGWRVQKGGPHCEIIPQEHLVVMRDEKVSPFVKFEIILRLPLCFYQAPLQISTARHGVI